MPRIEWASMKPGTTTLPVASITLASAGIGTSLPTASILPPRIRTTPFSIGGPATGMMRPPLTARRSWAASGPAAARVSVKTSDNG
jgi:hypothetical protein